MYNKNSFIPKIKEWFSRIGGGDDESWAIKSVWQYHYKIYTCPKNLPITFCQFSSAGADPISISLPSQRTQKTLKK